MKLIKKSPVRWDLLLKYRLIEIVSQWEGRLTTNVLTNAFGIGRQQASKYINQYMNAHQDNLRYNKFSKGFEPLETFKPAYTQGIADEYLMLISSQDDLASCFSDLNAGLTNTSVLYSPIRNIQAEIVHPIVQAAREKRRVEIEYVSMKTPISEGRVIAPHTLIWNGFRWHVRAYCEKNQDYRDFLLSRIMEKPEITLKASNTIEEDHAWNTEVIIEIRPDSRLSKQQKLVIARDYNMTRNKLKIRTQGALVKYMMQLLSIDSNIVKAEPEAQQIEISNIQELKNWLY